MFIAFKVICRLDLLVFIICCCYIVRSEGGRSLLIVNSFILPDLFIAARDCPKLTSTSYCFVFISFIILIPRQTCVASKTDQKYYISRSFAISMPNYCSVYGCYSSSSKNPDVSFFRFPKDTKLLKAWVCRVRRENFTPSNISYVCSRHFDETDMYIPATDTPTVFKNVVYAQELFQVSIFKGLQKMNN